MTTLSIDAVTIRCSQNSFYLQLCASTCVFRVLAVAGPGTVVTVHLPSRSARDLLLDTWGSKFNPSSRLQRTYGETSSEKMWPTFLLHIFAIWCFFPFVYCFTTLVISSNQSSHEQFMTSDLPSSPFWRNSSTQAHRNSLINLCPSCFFTLFLFPLPSLSMETSEPNKGCRYRQ